MEGLSNLKKKKVLFFICQMGAGGAARTLLNIINNLDREKFSPILVTLDFRGDYEKDLKEDIPLIKLNTKRLRKAIFPLAKLIRMEKPDIVFSTIPNYNTIAILANILSGTKAKNIVREADNLGGSFAVNVKLLGYGMLYKLSSQIVSLSEGVKENLVKRYKINAKHIEVIYNPVDLKSIADKTQNDVIDSEHAHLFEGDEKVVITAGRLVKQKDYETLLTAFAQVAERVQCKLIILGEGPLKDRLTMLAEKLNISQKVFFIGFRTNPYVYFKHADLFVLTSIHEGFSHVVAEALATGVPVVSTNCKSGPAEVLDNGKYGLLCRVGDNHDIADKMYQVLSYNEEQVQETIRNGYKRATYFDAKRIVKDYEAVFLKTLNH
jgi:glycosyltransferase involved in cell wall biosynthesis